MPGIISGTAGYVSAAGHISPAWRVSLAGDVPAAGHVICISGIAVREHVVPDQSVHLKRIEYAFCDGKGDVAKIVVKELVVSIGVDKSGFYEHGGHPGAAEDDQARTLLDPEVYKADGLQLFVYVLCHLKLQA